MSVHLPPHAADFPKAERATVPANAWGSQWRHLRGAPRLLVRNAMRDGLRWLRD